MTATIPVHISRYPAPRHVLGAGFDIALARPIDFAELDLSLRARMKRRVSGTRAKVTVRGTRQRLG
jgi:hypothetical protein